MQKNFKERRACARIQPSQKLECSKFEFGQKETGKTKAFIKSLSASGVLFETKAKYDISDVLDLRLDIPGWDKFKTEFFKPQELFSYKPLRALAKVVRVNRASEDSFQVGAHFCAIDADHRKALFKFIKQKINQ